MKLIDIRESCVVFEHSPGPDGVMQITDADYAVVDKLFKKYGLTEANYEGNTRQGIVRVYFCERLSERDYENLLNELV